MLIGVTGTYGAGKDTVADYLISSKKFNHYSLSDEIRIVLSEEGIPETRENLISKGNELRGEFGPDHLAQRVTAKAKHPAVITSIRNPYEVSHFKNDPDFRLIHVDADQKTRYDRTAARSRAGDIQTFEDFVRLEEYELNGDAEELSLAKCFQEADHVIYNDGTIEDLHRSIEKLLSQLNIGV